MYNIRMELLFGLYVLSILLIFFIGYKAVRSSVKVKSSTVDNIARLQQWEYLRSLDKDGRS